MLGCDTSRSSPTAEDDAGDCRLETQACAAGFACVQTASDAWVCVASEPDETDVPDAGAPDVVEEPDDGPTQDATEASDAEEPEDTSAPDPPDIEEETPAPPAVVLVLPPGVLGGLVAMEAVVSAPGPVLGVEFLIDGVQALTDVIPPFTAVINTAELGDGPHTITAWTADNYGQTAKAEAEVIVDNTPPQIESLTPPDGADIFFEDGPLYLAMDVGDATKIVEATLRANGLPVATLNAPPFEGTIELDALFLSVEKLPKNLYLQFRATDSLGQTTEVSHNVTMHSRLDWSFETLGEIWAGPIRVGEDPTIVFGNHDDKVVALNSDGTVKWEHQAPDDVTDGLGAHDPSGSVLFASLDGTLRSLNASGGTQWSHSLGSPPGGAPVVVGDAVYIAAFDGTVKELNVSNGSVKWQAALPGFVTATLAAGADGTLYVGCQDSSLYAVKDGVALWGVPTGDEVWSTPALGPEQIYFGSNDGWIYAANRESGTVTWKTSIEGQVWGRPLLTSTGGVYVAATNKRVHRLDAITGDIVWETKVGGVTRSWPVEDGAGTIYVATTAGAIVGLAPGSGAVVLNLKVSEKTIHGTPLLLDDGRVVVGSMDRAIYAAWGAGADPDAPPVVPDEGE